VLRFVLCLRAQRFLRQDHSRRETAERQRIALLNADPFDIGAPSLPFY
jgi:hypothetical protein